MNRQRRLQFGALIMAYLVASFFLAPRPTRGERYHRMDPPGGAWLTLLPGGRFVMTSDTPMQFFPLNQAGWWKPLSGDLISLKLDSGWRYDRGIRNPETIGINKEKMTFEWHLPEVSAPQKPRSSN